jgi:uncharacterized membrane protein YfcA
MGIGFSIALFAMAVGASALGGALGMASGIFIVPLLTMFGGVNIHTAVAASIVSVIACSCGSAAPFLREGFTNIRIAVVLETATTLGALTGVFLMGLVSTTFLFFLFAAILLVSAWQMTMRRREADLAEDDIVRDWATALGLHSTYPDRALGRDVFYQVRRLPLGLSLMYGAGVVSAMLGIGSGVLKIPAMDTALRLPIKVSSATSNFMIGVTAAASGVAYFARGEIVPAIAGPVALGSVLGAILGGRLLTAIPAEKLRLLFAAVLIALAVLMLLSAFGLRLPAHAR